MRIRRKFLCAGVALMLGLAGPDTMTRQAQAIVVFDPANYGQNLLQAARALTQINNQVRQITNQAQMLLNQARNLTSLPTSLAAEMRSSLGPWGRSTR